MKPDFMIEADESSCRKLDIDCRMKELALDDGCSYHLLWWSGRLIKTRPLYKAFLYHVRSISRTEILLISRISTSLDYPSRNIRETV